MKKTIKYFFFFLFISPIVYGQDYSLTPTHVRFNQLAKLHNCDTLHLGDYKIIRLKYVYSFLSIPDHFLEKMNCTLYCINDSIILKTYWYYDQDSVDETTDFSNIKRTPDFSDLFLFSDSTLGVNIYTFASAFNSGFCGSCSEEHYKIFRVNHFKTELFFDYKYSGYSDAAIYINNDRIYPMHEEIDTANIYRFIKWGDNIDFLPKLKIEWIETGKKLSLRFLTDVVDDNGKAVEKTCAHLTVEFVKKKDKYIYKVY